MREEEEEEGVERWRYSSKEDDGLERLWFFGVGRCSGQFLRPPLSPPPNIGLLCALSLSLSLPPSPSAFFSPGWREREREGERSLV